MEQREEKRQGEFSEGTSDFSEERGAKMKVVWGTLEAERKCLGAN